MNALELTQKTEETLVKVINDSGLPLTTIHYMLSNIQRQIIETLNQAETRNKESEE